MLDKIQGKKSLPRRLEKMRKPDQPSEPANVKWMALYSVSGTVPFEWCILQYFREYILKLNTAGTVCCRYSGLVVIPTCGCHRSGNGQGKNSSSSGKSEGISLRVREILILWRKSGKSKILRVHSYSFLSTFIVVWHLKFFFSFYGHESHCIVRMLFIKLNDKFC